MYLAGGAAHPGPGMPMVLMSGWIAADTLDQDAIVPRRPAALTNREPDGESCPRSSQPRHRVADALPARGIAAPLALADAALPALLPARYVRKHFHAVRLSASSAALPLTGTSRCSIVLNHPSWWDPMIGIVLSSLIGDRDHFAAIDAEAVEQYSFFKRARFRRRRYADRFAARPSSSASGTTILSRAESRLLGHGTGTFTDVRERPLALQSGVGHLAARLKRGIVLPVALEYAFWTERTPEALVRIGEPLRDRQTMPGFRARSGSH